MALSIPILNDIIVDKIEKLEKKLEEDEKFYKTTILNLTSQINLLTEQNTDLLNNLKKYEVNNLSETFLDKPPGLPEPIVLKNPHILRKKVVTNSNISKKLSCNC